MAHKKSKFEKIQFLLLSIVLFATAMNRMDAYPVMAYIIMGMSLILLLFFILGFVKKKKNHQLQVAGFICESIGLIFTAFVFLKDGKVFIPYMFILAAMGFFLAATIGFRRNRKKKIKNSGFPSDKTIA
ncbi:MAG TPA: hypothetical protein VFM70_05430 [Salinimicrobium sp.]|nr:hypothetical protein [Salinimicrobium sp.]